MEDSDDELPTLSADTFAALQQFYKEEVSFVSNLFKENFTHYHYRSLKNKQ
jgi:hypothetical protein